MQQASPPTESPAAAASAGSSDDPPARNGSSGSQSVNHVGKKVRDLVKENAVVVFARDDCCMFQVIKSLLHGHGVSPTIRLVSDLDEADVTRELSRFLRRRGGGLLPPFPAVFVGGDLLGDLDEVMRAHISGELVPKLRAARALWL